MPFKVINWLEYHEGAALTQESQHVDKAGAIDAWNAAQRSTPDGQATNSDSAMQTYLMLRAAFKLPLRQAERLLSSFIELPGCELSVPDHTTVSRRAIKLPSIARAALPEGPLHVVIDSTGLKIHEAGERLADNHGRRLAMDAGSGQIVGVTLTDQDVDDASQVEPLLEQIPGAIEQFTADGAHYGEPTYAAIATSDRDIAVVIPPRASSTPPIDQGTDASHRDVDVHMVAALGRLGWQEVTGYGRRALVETMMARYKTFIGPRLRARHDAGRRMEAAVGADVLNRTHEAGRPNFVRTVPDFS